MYQCTHDMDLWEMKREGCWMCREECRETSTLVCVCMSERLRGWRLGLPLQFLAHTVDGKRGEMRKRRGGEGYAMVLDTIIGRVLLVLLKVRLH